MHKNFKKKKPRILILFLVIFLFFSELFAKIWPGAFFNNHPMQLLAAGWSGGHFIRLSSYEEKLKEAEEKKKRLEQEQQKTQQTLKKLQTEREDILKYIEELDMELNNINLRIEQLEAEITSTEKELETTRKELEEAKQQETEQYENMKRKIQYMYENGNTSYLEILLNCESIADLLNQVEYYSKITEYDNELLERYQQTKLLVADKEACLELDLENYNQLKTAADLDRQTVETLISDKSNLIAEYTKKIGITDELLFEYAEEITSTGAEIEKIEEEERKRIEEEERKRKEEEERLRKEREERERQEAADRLNNAGNISKTDDTAPENMIWPLPGDGRIYGYFGNRTAPTAGASTYHRGLDIGGELGASIVAVLAGTIEVASYSVTNGNYIIVNHGNGIRTAYVHCSKLLASVGQYVQQGEVIALVGSTGIATGPHLHFGVSVNGTYVDPLNYISYK